MEELTTDEAIGNTSPSYNLEELIKDFKEFEEQSYTKYKDLYEQIKEDRKYIAGEQKDKIDITLTDSTVGEVIPPLGLNIIQNSIKSIVNTYIPNQFKIDYANAPDLNSLVSTFLSEADNSTATVEALTNAVGTGLGVLVFSTDYDIDGSVKPILYSLPDVTNVRLDPAATKLNHADSTKAAIIELKARKWVETTYGITLSSSRNPLIDISEEYDRKEYIPLVTYYIKDDNQVTCYKLVGEDIVEEPTVLPYSYIPIIPVFGESSWTSDNKLNWTGITTLLRPIQRMVNYSYRQVLIRAATVPKNTWVGTEEAIEGKEAYWKNANKTLNPLRIYNGWSKDRKREIPAPIREDSTIRFDDVSSLLKESLSLTNSIVGIPSVGLEANIERTATEVLSNEKLFNNNVRSYIFHLKSAMQLVGLLYAEEQYGQQLYGSIKVTVTAGPDEAMKRQEARVILSQLASYCSTDEQKSKLISATCSIESGNEYVDNFRKSLIPAHTQAEEQANQLLEQANAQLKQKDAELLELQKQLNDIKLQQQLQAYSTEQQMLLNQQKFEQEKELKLMDINSPANLAKEEAEIEKANIALEKEAIGLRKELIRNTSAYTIA